MTATRTSASAQYRPAATQRHEAWSSKNKPPTCFRRWAVVSPSGIMGASRLRLNLSQRDAIRLALLRLVVRRGRTLLVLRHELVELFLVLGVTQALEEILELDLLFFEALQGFRAVLVEGAVAA